MRRWIEINSDEFRLMDGDDRVGHIIQHDRSSTWAAYVNGVEDTCVGADYETARGAQLALEDAT